MKSKYYVMYRYANSVCLSTVFASNELEAFNLFEKLRKKFKGYQSYFLGLSVSSTFYAWDVQRIDKLRKKSRNIKL